MNEGREVYDGWHYWRARIVPFPSPIRRRYGCRFVKERKFASFSWQQVGMSRWFESFEECEKAANNWLDAQHYEGDVVK